MLGAMAREFFAGSPLLLFPVAALVLFIAAFTVAAWRALRRRPDEVEALANLPLADDREEVRP